MSTTRGALDAGRRLGCQARIRGDLVIDVPAEFAGPPAGRAQARRSPPDRHRSRRAPLLCRGSRARHARPVERSAPPAIGADRAMGPRRDGGRSERVARSAENAARRRLEGDRRAAQGPRHRRPSRRASTNAPWASPSTSARRRIAAHLCDLASGEVVASAGLMNPQIRFGEDLMSRVSYVMMNPGGDAELTRSVRAAVGSLIGEVVRRGGGRPRRYFRDHGGRQSDHASSVPRPRSDRTRRRAVRADPRRRLRGARARIRP